MNVLAPFFEDRCRADALRMERDGIVAEIEGYRNKAVSPRLAALVARLAVVQRMIERTGQ